MNLVLIGLRGAGKTTVGRRVAARLGRGFVDLDEQVMARLGLGTVRQAWEQVGEAGFRQAEAAALAEVLTVGGCVIALGGGTAMIAGVAEMLRGEHVVYLRAAAETLRKRLRQEAGDRVSLTGAGIVEEVDSVRKMRDPVYTALASVILEIDGLGVDEVVARVVEAFPNP